MEEVLLDITVELVAFAVFWVVAGILAFAGFVWENIGITSLLTGEIVLGLWYVYMGSLALYVGIYLIGYREIPSRLAALRATVSE